MGQTLSEPNTQKTSVCIRNALYQVGSSAMQGWRITMEDAHVQLLSLPDDPEAAYFAVFDGHGGPAVARYAARNLHQMLQRRPEYGVNPQEALRRAFLDCDRELRCNVTAEEVGSTAIVALLKNNSLYCANLGDSRAVACIDGKCEPLSQDHKPENTVEWQRIYDAGGWVHSNRVNGNLALSRAFGDFIFKNNNTKRPDQQIVIAYPDIETRTIHEGWEFIVLACDGIWDVMSSDEVVQFCRLRIANAMPVDKICEDLLNTCLAPEIPVTGCGGDNMTVMIVCFVQNGTYESFARRCAADTAGKNVGDTGSVRSLH